MISSTTKSFIDSLIDYYISEAGSYKQMAKSYSEEIDNIHAVAFGIILGSIYAAFIQSYANQQQKPSLEDMQEFTQLVKKKAAQIKRSIIDAKI
jgi:tryptophan synthase alpha subunit